MGAMYIKNVDTEKKNKALFVLKCKDKYKTNTVTEMIDKLAE